ncbi:TIR domain-containing protein [Burkholderia ubonensis]|uniref:TIR domain-containing protein n=1 Tax=Burkholderia ubonensis TaxID=101571 RepID=UPI0015C6B02B|nr:nucleotide-binding protein [Burkholderia ubonensis]
MKPKVFIGSSVEGLDFAQGIAAGLEYASHPVPWTATFPASGITIDSLLEEFAKKDFAVFVFSPDDVAKIREKEYAVARDNVLFEAGLFMGMHGRNRVFIVTPRGTEKPFHVASDLLGFTPIVYDHDWAKEESIEAGTNPAFHIKSAIKKSDWFDQRLDITGKKVFFQDKSDTGGNITYKTKLFFNVSNNTTWPVVVESLEFNFGEHAACKLANIYGKRGASVHKPEFHTGVKHDKKQDDYKSVCHLYPGESVNAWVAYEPDTDPVTHAAQLNALATSNKLATWTYSCAWDGGRPRKYREQM